MKVDEFKRLMRTLDGAEADGKGAGRGCGGRAAACGAGAEVQRGMADGSGDVLSRLRAEANGEDREPVRKEQHEEAMHMRIVRLMATVYADYAPLLVHNANEFRGTKAQGAKRKALGVRKGFPDFSFFLPTCYYHGLHIELKWGRNVQSAEQKEYQKLLESHGYQYVVCRSEEEFMRGMREYIMLGRWGSVD